MLHIYALTQSSRLPDPAIVAHFIFPFPDLSIEVSLPIIQAQGLFVQNFFASLCSRTTINYINPAKEDR